MIDKVAGARYISTPDLAKGYYQVPLHPSAVPKTSFITPQGKFEFLVLSFGLKNAPATFQCLMDNVLAGLDNALAYLDDIVIYSDSWEQHKQHLGEVFTRLHQAGLRVKRSKCHFGTATVSFLGHIIGRGQVRPHQTKVAAIENYAVPWTKADLRAFLSLVGYYRSFIPRFSSRVAALTDLTSSKQPDKLHLQQEYLDEFHDLRKALLQHTVLTTFDPRRKTILHTDASDRGLGICLSQVDAAGQERPITYYSRKMLPRETRYTVSEKEALAAVEAVRYFSTYLLGAEFQLVTDHKALLALHRMTGGGGRLTRWALALQPYHFTITHRPGKDHGNADGLSRQSWPTALDEPSQESSAGDRAPSVEGGGCWVPLGLRPMDNTLPS